MARINLEKFAKFVHIVLFIAAFAIEESATLRKPGFVYLVSFVFKWFFKKLTHTPKPNPRAKASAKLPYGTRNTQHVFSTHLKRAQFN